VLSGLRAKGWAEREYVFNHEVVTAGGGLIDVVYNAWMPHLTQGATPHLRDNLLAMNQEEVSCGLSHGPVLSGSMLHNDLYADVCEQPLGDSLLRIKMSMTLILQERVISRLFGAVPLHVRGVGSGMSIGNAHWTDVNYA
jgi:hypothetical protein